MLIELVFDFYVFFFQAEDGIRDVAVTGVQTCALPISPAMARSITPCHLARSSGWTRRSRSSQVGGPFSGSKPYRRYHSSDRCKASLPATCQAQLPVCVSLCASAT